MPTIHYWPQKNKPQPLSHLHRLTLDNVTLQQGANEVTAQDYSRVQAHTDTARLVENGVLELEGEVAIAEPVPLPEPPPVEQVHREAGEELPTERKLPANGSPRIEDRLAELQTYVKAKDWRSLKTIAEGHGITRPGDGWDAAVLPILIKEYGEQAAEEAFTQPE